MGRKTKKKRIWDTRNRERQGKASRPVPVSPCSEVGLRNPYTVLVVCGFLLLAVALVFGQTVRHEFVNIDDPVYVYENTQVACGLTAQGIAWAFTTGHAGNWHPLTWLSHILDCQLYGLKWPGGHHLTNVLLHAATATLLFLALWQMTCQLWPSAFAAALFAAHPLRVESVAWVTERKDVLSGLFFMLVLLAYVAYARRKFSITRYALVAVPQARPCQGPQQPWRRLGRPRTTR
jgi:hypothetical protein